MKRLGDLDLPSGLQWVDQYGSFGVMQSLQNTIAGTAVISSRSLSFAPMTLSALDPWCWVSQEQTDALLAMAETPGGSFVLVWGDLTLTVVFRHHDPPAVDLVPISPGILLYVGTIKLLRI